MNTKFLVPALLVVSLVLSGCGTTIYRTADGKIKRVEFPRLVTVSGEIGVTNYPSSYPPVVVTPTWTLPAYTRQTEMNYGLKPR